MANDSDSIGRSILRETVARDDRNYGHHHKNGFAHYTLLPITRQNVSTLNRCRRARHAKNEIPTTVSPWRVVNRCEPNSSITTITHVIVAPSPLPLHRQPTCEARICSRLTRVAIGQPRHYPSLGPRRVRDRNHSSPPGVHAKSLLIMSCIDSPFASGYSRRLRVAALRLHNAAQHRSFCSQALERLSRSGQAHSRESNSVWGTFVQF
jgi:hypothetical protein